MSTYGSVIPGAKRLAGAGAELSPQAKQRLAWMDWHRAHGENVSLTCRHFGISRPTFYRWQRRYRPHDLSSLEDRSRRPRQHRPACRPAELVAAVQALRERFVRWGKDKLVVLLRKDGWQVATSLVGRILTDLKRRGLLREPVRQPSARRRAAARAYAVRKPKDYPIEWPGDLVQLDTQEQHPEPGVTIRHFAARDMVSRWDVLAVHSRATARIGASFLDEVVDRMPFPVRAVQIDGGSEFKAEFETACQHRGLRLFLLPPKSPKLNGRVERSHRTHEEEFYQCYGGDLTLAALQPALRAWETVYNTVRPHQALGYLTPSDYLARYPPPNDNGAAPVIPAAAPLSV